MSRKILAVLLVALMALTMGLPVFAEEEAQVIVIPVTKIENGFYAGGKSENAEDVSLMATGEMVTIDYIYTENFFLDSKTFDIMVSGDLKDSRQKLTLSLKDEDGTLIANQTGAYYKWGDLVYQMEVVKTLDEDAEYFVELKYTGKHNGVDAETEDSFYADGWIAIKDIDVLNYSENSFKIYLANVTAGEEFTVFYEVDYGSTIIKRDAIVASDKSITVTFGDSVTFSNWGNSIYICDAGTDEQDYYDYLTYVWDFDDYGIDDVGGDISNEGVYCDDVIGLDHKYLWFGMYQKGFAYAKYSETEKDNINVYLFDATTGKTVGEIDKTSLEYDQQYGEFYGSVKIKTGTVLDAAHDYIMVFKDGYSMRTQKVDVTADKKLGNVNMYDLNKKHMSSLPVSTTKFYAYASSINISDRSNIKVELINGSGNVVATSKFESSSGYHKMEVTGLLSVGTYTLKATYGSISYTKKVDVVSGSNSAVWQNVYSGIVYGGKTYITWVMDTNEFDVEKLTYKLEFNDGRKYALNYHRTLYKNDYEVCFVVTYNGELSSEELSSEELSNNYAYGYAYNGSTQIVPTQQNNVRLRNVSKKYQPFVYNSYNTSGDYLEIYLEGLTAAKPVTICAFDDETKKAVEVSASSKTAKSAKFKKSDLAKIKAVCYYDTYYGFADKACYVEIDGELSEEMYFGGYDGIVTFLLNDAFCFQQSSTSDRYAVLNLPKSKYTKYKIATSEAALNSASYKTIEEGLLYDLGSEQGKVTVYAKFKTASGVESSVLTASIKVDSIPPEVDILNVNTKLVIDEDYIRVPVELSVDENCIIHYGLYDSDENLIGYVDQKTISMYDDETYLYFWTDDYDYSSAAKLIMWFEDTAGNRGGEFEYAVSFVDDTLFTDFDEDNGYISIECLEDVYGANVYAATYKGDKLTSIQRWNMYITTDGEYFEFENFDDSADEIRIMIWDSELGNYCDLYSKDLN